jgi:hypothetical protein
MSIHDLLLRIKEEPSQEARDKLDNINDLLNKFKSSKCDINILILHFEDDTIKSAISIDNKYLMIINNWYKKCCLLLDIEKTPIYIPESFYKKYLKEINKILGSEIPLYLKDEYIYNYIPSLISNIISDEYIKNFEIKINKGRVSNSKSSNSESSNNELCEMGIKIPENIRAVDVYHHIVNNKKIIYPINIKDLTIDTQSKEERQVGNNMMLSKTDSNKILMNSSSIRSTETIFEVVKIENTNVDIKVDQQLLSLEYGVYDSNFDNYFHLDYDYDMKKNNEVLNDNSNTLLIGLFNKKFLKSMIIKNPDEDELYAIQNYNQYGFIKVFSILTNNKDVIDFIDRNFNILDFNNIDELNIRLISISEYIELSNKNIIIDNSSEFNEEKNVKNYFKKNYTINSDINNKMKASTLHDLIINHTFVLDKNKLSGFKNRLSRYLKELGLEKKRYNDGFYYYGIKANTDNTILDFQNLHINLYEERKKQDKDFKLNISSESLNDIMTTYIYENI